MTRRRSALAFGSIVLAVAFAACGGVPITVNGLGQAAIPTPTPISDPKVIIARSFAAVARAQTVHLDASLNGSINAGALSRFAGGFPLGLIGKLKLDDSTVSGDLDIENLKAHASAKVPALLGLTVDVIVADGYTYTKSSLSGGKYRKSRTSPTLQPAGSLAPSASRDVAGALDALEAGMERAGVTSTFVGHDMVDGRDAFHVAIWIPPDEINRLISSAGGNATAGLTIDSVSLDCWADVDTFLPSRIESKVTSSTLGVVSVTATLTRYNEPVTIDAPPDSQVQAG